MLMFLCGSLNSNIQETQYKCIREVYMPNNKKPVNRSADILHEFLHSHIIKQDFDN